jgi:hypothetical protein
VSNPTFIKAYEASADIEGKRFVMFSDAANNSKVATANGATAPIIGVSDAMGALTGGMCDVKRAGLATVKLGGTVAAGDPLTAAADGRAIKCDPAAGATRRVAGFADAPGVANDEIPCWLASSLLHEPV